MPVVEIAHNPNDFYYMSSGKYQDVSGVCPTYLREKSKWDSICCTDISDKNDTTICPKWDNTKCYEYEVCKNKEYADLANKLQNNNGGSNERRSNLKKQYHNEILKTINISASILIITYLSVYFFKA
jgi:hypothetical protein